MEEAERQMAGRGRLLVRFSGTEPLLRIMMEGPERDEIAELTENVRRAAAAAIGATSVTSQGSAG